MGDKHHPFYEVLRTQVTGVERGFLAEGKGYSVESTAYYHDATPNAAQLSSRQGGAGGVGRMTPWKKMINDADTDGGSLNGLTPTHRAKYQLKK